MQVNNYQIATTCTLNPIDLVVAEKGIITIYQNKKNKKLVSARELHTFLESGQDFTTWIKNRIDKYGFVEDKDFTLHKFMEGKTWKHEYIITVGMAKELSMVENNDKGKQARQYFINCEEKLKEVATNINNLNELSPQLQLLIGMELKQKQLESSIKQTKEEIQSIRDVITLNPQAAWRRECNRILNAIGTKTGNYKLHKEEVYKALKERGSCRPNVLVNNLKKRAEANGMAPSKVEKLNILDVLENEPRLKDIYVNIVKEMAIKHNVRV